MYRQNTILEQLSALELAVTYGIINHEDAEQQKMTNIEKYIKEEFAKYDAELKINYLESNGTYRIRVIKKLQESLNLKPQYYGSSEKIVLNKLFDDLNGAKKFKITFAELWKIWHKEREQDPDVDDNTVEKDLQLYNRWIKGKPLEQRLIKSITVKDMKEFFKDTTKGRTITESSFRNLKSMINIFFDFAVDDYEVMAFNPSRQLKVSKYKTKPSSNKINDVFTTEEIIRLWHYMIEKNTVYSLACALTFCLGCRVGEIKALKWSDFDWKNKTVYIHAEVKKEGKYANQQIYSEHTKSGLTEGNRELPLVDDAITTLELIKAKACDEEFLFLGKTRKFILTQEFNDNIKDACNHLNIPYMSSHKTRKWAVTESVRNGMDQVTLMYTYGWKSTATADKYIKKYRTKQNQLVVLNTVFNKTNNQLINN